VLGKERPQIQSMFAAIAHRYDRANHLLSFRVDRSWRKTVATTLLDRPGKVLDLASGTGDLAVDLNRRAKHRVVAADFTLEMLIAGREKIKASPGIWPLGADALQLPFTGGSFDAVSVAFGIRNFFDPQAGLREIYRVLRPGGVAGILEFSQPRGLFGKLYSVYATRVLPRLGGWITGCRAPYEYLPASVRTFPEGEAFTRLMKEAGFTDVDARRLTGGIVTFYVGRRG
jgi:demethylmenaquinone methyltransferase / 2-methoxy-6-polyprenyl-1,4-benzoquinol methylase